MLVIGEWAARRQADVLLYLGAFLLVISALIFTASRDEALFGGWRVVVLAVYTAAFLAAGLLLRRWPRVQEAGPVFLAIGALMMPLNFLLLYNEVLGDREVSRAVVWFVGSAYSTVFYGFLFSRGFGRLYAIPAAIALLNAWGWLADAAGLPQDWGGAWWMGFALAATIVLSVTRRWSMITAAPVAAIVVLSLFFSQVIAALSWADIEYRWQLPVTYALLTALVAVAGWSARRPLTVIAVALLAVAAGFAAVWAAELPAQWFSAPPLVAAALLLVSRPLWQSWSPRLAHGAWLLTATGVLAPFVLADAHLHGDRWVAAAAFLAAGALSAAVAWRNSSDGIFASHRNSRSTTHPLERVAFGWLAFGSLLIAVGFAQEALELASPDTGWAFAAVGLATSAGLVVATRRVPMLLWAILPALLLATNISIQYPVDRFAGHDAVLLALPAAHVLAAFVLLRRWSLAAVSVALGMLALAALWESQAWPWWQLAALYAAMAIPLFGVLAPLRHYGPVEDAELEEFWAVQAISWLPVGAGILAAVIALDARLGDAAIEAPATAEYRALVLIVLLLAPLITFEAWRFRRWEPGVAALLILLVCVAALWPVFDWPTWTLAATYAVAGAGGFVALTRWRRVADDSGALAVQALSWLPLAAAMLAAAAALEGRLAGGAIEAPATTEYRTLVLIVLLLAPLITFEAWRFRRWEPGVAALLILLACVAALWPVFDWPTWTLATTYAAAGTGGFVALTRWRRVAADSAALAVQALSWLPLATAILAAVIALEGRLAGGAIEASGTAEYRVLVLAVLLLAPLITFEAWRFRRWEPGVAALLILLACVAALWPVFDWPTWTLAATYAAAGAGGFVALTRWRRVAGDSAALAVQALSWLPVGAGILAALIALDDRLIRNAAIEAPATAEYRTLVLVVLLLAPLITFEAWRFRRWEPGVAALLILLACVAALWPVFDWPAWTLAATYAVAGAGGFVALTRWRRVAGDSAALAVQALSWLPVGAGILAALIALDDRLIRNAAIEAPATAEYRTLVLVVLLLVPLITFEAWRFRRWEPGVAALLILLACVAALWPVFDWPAWTLAATYAVAGAGGFVALTRWRRVAGDSAALAVQALSWLPVGAGILAALIALDDRLIRNAAIEAPATAEYRTLVLVVLLLAPLITFEAWRFRRWEPGVAALLILLACVAALWPVFDWPAWTLAATYAAAGAGGFVALTRWRRVAEDSGALAVQALSWLPLAAAMLAAADALEGRLRDAAIEVPATAEYRTLVLVVLLLAPLISFEAWRFRRWEPMVAVLAVVFGCAAALWPVFDWPVWTLAGAYSLAGVGAFLALSRRRRTGRDSTALAVQALSWAGLLLGPLTALVAIGVRLEMLDANPATLVEFRTLAALLLPVAAAVEFEGRRLGIRWASLPASALVMVALELAIATLEPGNVQAHTVPAALYLALVGLAVRTSGTLSRHLSWHELLQLAGAALLVLPQAEQGFEPGGTRWGLVLLVEGFALLGIAMVLGARWLGVSAVITLSGVALRFLWLNRESEAVPYWVMLAVAGFLLLGVGMTILLQREWWDRTRVRVRGWWGGEARLDAHSPLAVPVPALFTALAPVLAILAVANLD